MRSDLIWDQIFGKWGYLWRRFLTPAIYAIFKFSYLKVIGLNKIIFKSIKKSHAAFPETILIVKFWKGIIRDQIFGKWGYVWRRILTPAIKAIFIFSYLEVIWVNKIIFKAREKSHAAFPQAKLDGQVMKWDLFGPNFGTIGLCVTPKFYPCH